MPSPIREGVSRKEFEMRRQRAILSVRRKRDFVWVFLTVVPFIVAVTLLVFKVRLRAPEPAATASDRP